MHTEQTQVKSFSAEEQVKTSAFSFDDLLDKQFPLEFIRFSTHGDEEEDEKKTDEMRMGKSHSWDLNISLHPWPHGIVS